MSGKETENNTQANEKAGGDFPLPAYLLPWFDRNKRDLPWRKSKDAYAVWVSEIMLQQTRVEAAKEHYIRFMRALPTVFDLAACDDERLMKLWEGLGYYSRARNLKKCAVQVVETYGGVFPRDKALLRKLPGIGEYTAGAVSSIAYDEKNPAVDGNVLRVCARAEGDFTPIDDAGRRKALTEKLAAVYPERAGDYTQSLMELGALVCLPDNPKCGECPLRGHCVAEREGWQARLPVMPLKAEKKRERLAVFIVRTPVGAVLRKRSQKGVLAGMWEFPNRPFDGFGAGEEERERKFLSDVLEVWGMTEKNGQEKEQVFMLRGKKEHTHVFTHLVWEMTGYVIDLPSVPAGMQVFSAERIQKELSVPSAFRWCLDCL